jgi:tRNA(His) 5'-end guanylyltransferase
MDSNAFERRMRSLEAFHALRCLPGAWIVLRVDGRGFSRFTATRFQKPFDAAFHALMLQTAQALLEDMQGCYAYTESDEISVLFPPGWDQFDREVEKLVSISAGIATAAFTHAAGTPAHFDSRVWLGTTSEDVVDYFCWRQDDATRCALNGWCYWTLRKAGRSAGQATTTLKQQTIAFKNELLFQHGINFNELPAWQRRGAGLLWQHYEKTGHDPIRNQPVTVTRRRIAVDEELPVKVEYAAFIRHILEAARPPDS